MKYSHNKTCYEYAILILVQRHEYLVKKCYTDNSCHRTETADNITQCLLEFQHHSPWNNRGSCRGVWGVYVDVYVRDAD